MDDRGCSCHITAPCSYCMEKVECIICGELVHPDEAEFAQKAADDEYGPICRKCFEKEGEDGQRIVKTG